MSIVFKSEEILELLEEERLRRAVRAPGYAAVMNLFWPGSGHVYTGYTTVGFILSVGHMAFLAALMWLFFNRQVFDWRSNGLLLFCSGASYMYLWTWAIKSVFALPAVMPAGYDPARPMLAWDGMDQATTFGRRKMFAAGTLLFLLAGFFAGCASPLSYLSSNQGHWAPGNDNRIHLAFQRLEETFGSEQAEAVTRALLSAMYQELGDLERAAAFDENVALSSGDVGVHQKAGKMQASEVSQSFGRKHESGVQQMKSESMQAFEGKLASASRMDKTSSATRTEKVFCPETLMEKARNKHRSGDLSGAEELYRLLVDIDPDNASAINHLAFICVRFDRGREAIGYFRRLLELRPGNSQFSYYLGVELYKVGDFREAIRYLGATTMKERNYWLGMAYLELGEELEARKYLTASLDYSEPSSEVLNVLGNMSYNRGSYPEALQYFEAALTLEPQQSDTLYKIGLSRKMNGEPEKALKAFRNAIDLSSAGDAVAVLASRQIDSMTQK